MDLSIAIYIIKVHYHLNNDYIEKVKCITNLNDISEYEKTREEVFNSIYMSSKRRFLLRQSLILEGIKELK